MKKRVTKNLRKSLSVVVSAFVLAIGGACFVAFGGNEVQAEGTIIESSDGRYIAVPVEQVQELEGTPVHVGYLFAGWMKENDNGALKVISSKNNATYAKFVPEELLTIKAQTTQSAVPHIEGAEDGNKYEGKYVFRFVSSVESLNYYSVGYEVVAEDGTIYTNTADAVCHRIDSTTNGAEYTYSPKVVDVESEYFITAKFPVAPGENNENLDDLYTVRAFWKTFDGTMVYGAPRKLSVSDGLAATTTLNVSFVSESTTNIDETTVLTVTYDGGKSAQANVIGVDSTTKTVHVRVTVDKSTLHSVTEFAFSTSGGTALGTVTYRNLDTKYTGDQTADITWYDANETEYVIATSADLYGLASINESFAGKTIYVVSDIEANKGQATESAWSTTKDADEQDITDGSGTDFLWTPIGKTTPFAGTFEGNMHTISGIYAETSADGLGLFAETAKGSNIQNLKLKNSYFKNEKKVTTPSGTGSIVGQCAGNVVNICSDAYVVSGNYSGGIVGQILTTSDYKVYIQKCWFNGSIKNPLKRYQHGGIIGNISGGDIVMVNCLNTGTIDCNGAILKGGLCGGVKHDSENLCPENCTINFTMEDCLNYGQIVNQSSVATPRTGSVVGDISGPDTTVDISNVYATDECYNGKQSDIPGCGYKNSTYKGTIQITEVPQNEIDFEQWGFDTSIWNIDSATNKPALIMTMPVPE